MKKLVFLLLAVLCVSVISGCGDRNREGGKSAEKRKARGGVAGDALVTSSLGDASGLIYNITSDSASHDVAKYIYNGLVKLDKNLNITGDLAESWEISDDSRSITFKLRDNVKWHDGAPFTASDVEFMYNFMIDNNTPTSYDADFRLVTKFEVIDPLTVKVSYAEPFAPALLSWSMAVLPKHLLEGKEAAKSSLMRSPVGTGPYRFKEWKSGESITLEANDEYFEGRPNLDRIIFRIIPDLNTTFMELLNGSLDIMGLTPTQWVKQTDTALFTNSYDKYTYLAPSYAYIGYNMKNPMFADKRVRQALTYATPKQEIIDGILFGEGVPAEGPYKPGTMWQNTNVKKYEYSPEKAKELLAEAGWKDTNGDGILDKDGKPFTFTLLTNQGNSVRTKIAETVQQSWQKVGIKVDIRVLEWASFINEYIDKGKFDAVVLGWNIVVDPDPFDVWHSSKCGPKMLNFICFSNAEADQLIEGGRHALDPAKRKEYYDRFQEILAEEQPYTFLYVPNALIALSKRFKEVSPAPAGVTYNIEDWYVPSKDQKYRFEK
ncbi:MAG: peptide-binding protein [Geovibrio sp.]|nr:peptide-binding protein [Geovibrio sp.]